MKTKTTLFAAALIVAATAAVPAHSVDAFHFGLRSSVPADGASVTPPEALQLTFTQVPQEGSVSVRLVDPAGELVETSDPAYDDEDRRVIHVAVEKMLVASDYTVRWRGIGDDGHVVTGDFSFSVTSPK